MMPFASEWKLNISLRGNGPWSSHGYVVLGDLRLHSLFVLARLESPFHLYSAKAFNFFGRSHFVWRRRQSSRAIQIGPMSELLELCFDMM